MKHGLNNTACNYSKNCSKTMYPFMQMNKFVKLSRPQNQLLKQIGPQNISVELSAPNWLPGIKQQLNISINMVQNIPKQLLRRMSNTELYFCKTLMRQLFTIMPLHVIQTALNSVMEQKSASVHRNFMQEDRWVYMR